KGGVMSHKRRKKVLRLAKGYYGARHRLFRTAKEAVMKTGRYAYIGRKQKKREFRRLWITRISAGCKMNDMNYSSFMNGLKKSGVTLNRKMLSEMAIHDAEGFAALCAQAKAAL
ncbi:MAG: 50S ribosomal protein L20, partial [Ruminococcaceae bacterium]|nr:50S ribosomal protein L20 [Oscillospiraceae bacterium]